MTTVVPKIRETSPPLLVPSTSSSQLNLLSQTSYDPSSSPDEPPYVLHVVSLSDNAGYIFSASDDTIKVFPSDLTSAQPIQLNSTQRGISSLSKGKGEMANDVIFVTAKDGTVTGWDTRDLSKELFKLRSKTGAPYLCSSQSSDLSCLAVGTELHHHEASIDIWDLRTLKLQHSYTEAHSDDITSLSFHPSPSLPHVLLSSSVDGLLNTYDVRIQDEDDSILSTCQVGTSLIDAGWMRRVGKTEQEEKEWKGVWASTSIETMQFWDVDDQSLVKDLGDIRDVALEPWRSDYLISATYSVHLGGVAIFVGTQRGDGALINLSDTSRWVLEKVLPGVGGRTLGGKGHADIIRCVAMDPLSATVVTGGEDGRICLWSA